MAYSGNEVDFMPERIDTELMVHDPLLSELNFPHRAIFYPLGFPLEIETNSEEVIQAARQSWGRFRCEFGGTPIRISIGVAAEGDSQLPPPPVFRSRGHLMSIVSSVENFLICDLSRASAFGWVTPLVAATQTFLRRHFLEAGGLSLIGNTHLAPMHAALVARNGRGVLLCGEVLRRQEHARLFVRPRWMDLRDGRRNVPLAQQPGFLRHRKSSRHPFP